MVHNLSMASSNGPVHPAAVNMQGIEKSNVCPGESYSMLQPSGCGS